MGHNRVREAAVALGLAGLLVVGACRSRQGPSSPGPGPDGKKPLICFVGGTMRPAMEKIVELYKETTGEEVLIDYAGSGELLVRIDSGQPCDVFVCHDPFMDILMQKKLGVEAWTVAAVTPVIVVQKGNPKNVTGLKDLARDGMKVILTDYTYSTLGNMLATIFRKAGVDFEALKKSNVKKTIKSGGQAANEVKMGHMDAGMCWNAVAFLRLDGLDVVDIPPEYLPQPGAKADTITSATGKTWDISRIRVTISTVKNSKRLQAARAFATFVGREESRKVFASLGFTSVAAKKEY